MQYYIFEPACDTPETGSQFPQIQKMNPDYDYDASNSVHSLSGLLEFPDFEPNLDYFVVHSQAKLTDLLSVAVIQGGFLISENLKQVLEGFNIAPHYFYPAKLKHRKVFYENYYWMHIICDLTKFVDYKKSIFYVYDYFRSLGFVRVSSKEDYLEKEKEIRCINPDKAVTIWAQKIYMNEAFDKALDLFEIGAFNINYFISERLRNEIINKKITGCSIIPANNLEVSD